MASLPSASGNKEKFPALYSTPSVASNIERKELLSLEMEPGPGAYFGPDSAGFGSFGEQRFSRNKSEPSIKFARTGWKEWKGVFITRQHRPANAGDDVPGPGTYRNMKSLSTLNLETGVAMPTGQRWRKKALETASPGPRYDVRGKHWQDVTTNTKKNNAARFGKGERFEKPKLSGIDVGPGQYDRKDTAIKLDYASAKSFGLGFEAYEKVVTVGWETNGKGTQGSGPGEPLWRDPLNARDVVVHAIPKANRWGVQKKPNEVPGPGHYTREERDTSKLEYTVANCPNVQNIRFGKPSTKPRFRQQLLLRCNNAGWGYF